jgi:hypothetical protein
VSEIDGSADDETVVRLARVKLKLAQIVTSTAEVFASFMGLLKKAACIYLFITQVILDVATRRLRRTKDHVYQTE